jgi:ferredoxin-thioredoxin reductase catalytic subunit
MHYFKNKNYNMTLEQVKNNIKDGWILNPNEKIVNGILKGINRNNGECPCNNNSENKMCPCSNYRLHNHCCCTLYVKK